MVTEDPDTRKRLAKNSTQAWLARPSKGGAVSASLNPPPSSPVSPFFEARGCTFTAKLAPFGVSRIAIMTGALGPSGIGMAAPLQYCLMASLPQSDPIFDLLKRAQTIAVVGLSNSPLRPSHGVSAYMQTHGYRIIPVNPNIQDALGEKAYASLLEVPASIDIVNVFRRSEYVEEIVDQAIQRNVPVIWMQEEVINQKAAEKARRAGIFVIMDRCILREHKARFG
jgi:predicted CoA-binding protein